MVQDEEIKALLKAFVSGWGSSQHVGSTRNTLGYQERPFNLGRKIFLGAGKPNYWSAKSAAYLLPSQVKGGTDSEQYDLVFGTGFTFLNRYSVLFPTI